jgi:hypothetical protein
MKNTFVNKNFTNITWPDFFELCATCSPVSHGPDSKRQFSFRKNGIEVMHRVRMSTKGTVGKTGWFSYSFTNGTTYNDHHLSKGGHIRVMETIDINSPMTKAGQPAFVGMIEKVLNSKRKNITSSKFLRSLRSLGGAENARPF